MKEHGLEGRRRLLLPLLVTCAAIPLLFTSGAVGALSLANPPVFNYALDVQGADDQPGQRDLDSLAVSDTAGDLWVSWKWDVTELSGSNSGDACALFDSNANQNANYALCVTISGTPAVQAPVSPRVYVCADGKTDRCTSPVQITPINSACLTRTTSALNISAEDPFHNNQFDTVAVCHIDPADVGGRTTTGPVVLDTCSYPSQQPKQGPSDCLKH